MTPTHADPIQNEIEEKGLNAPRVRPEDLEAEIEAEFCFTASTGAQYGAKFGNTDAIRRLDLLTICVLVLHNGITVTGQSACVSPENFDADIGRKIARKNAVDQLWPLLGFRLADNLAAGRTTEHYRSAVTGRFVTEGEAQEHPDTTTHENR